MTQAFCTVHRWIPAISLTDLLRRASLNLGGRLRGAIMTLHKRVLLLGPTGVDKGAAVQHLGEYIQERHGHTIRYIDFEKDFLKPVLPKFGLKNFFTFLAQDSNQQATIWKAAWANCAKTFDSNITVLGLHAAYVNTIVGLRCPIELPSICNSFQPTIAVTLTDDVQRMWFRTEERAAGNDARGRPSFEQLLTARRAEQLLGDMIVTHSETCSRHIMVAALNAVVALANVIIFDAPLTYLSFPISAPRRMKDGGDGSFIDLLNRFHRLALEQMEKDTSRAFITPLAIDELPMIKKWERAPDTPLIYSDVRDRWAQSDLWGSDDKAILPPINKEFEIPPEQIDTVAGIVGTDVGWRDRRLVLQSRGFERQIEIRKCSQRDSRTSFL